MTSRIAVLQGHKMSNPFAILAEYPEGGPEVPQRQKIHREKNKHEPGTGRRDTEKRQGRGKSNWGNALDDVNRPPLKDGEVVEEEANAETTPKVQYVPASSYFSSSDDEDEDGVVGVPSASKKQVLKVPSEFADMIVEKTNPNVVVRKYSDDEDENEIELGFLNSAEAAKKRQEDFDKRRTTRGGRGGPRGRGGERGRGDMRGRGRGRGGESGRPYQPAARPEGAKPEGERPATGDRQNRPRDARPTNVQHQRQTQNRGARGGRGFNNERDFPSLQKS